MADKHITVEVVAPERIAFSNDVDFVVVPGIEGYMGILPQHAPIVSGLNIGVLKVIDAGKETKVAISGGFMEVNENKVVILADTAELGSEIDVVRAKEAKERAEARLSSKSFDVDVARAEMALRRAVTRLKASGHE